MSSAEISPNLEQMKVIIDVANLKIGMYVCELDRPWRETPFLFQGFEISSQEEIDRLSQYCQKVHVLTRESRQKAALASAPAPTVAAAPPEWQSGQAMNLEREVLKINNRPSARPVYADLTSMQEEADRVRDVFIELRLLIQEVLHDAKLGRSLNLPGVKQTVRNITESVVRNPDALMCFAQLKRKDEYTALHSLRTCILALTLGRQLGMPRERLEILGLGALLHDIGKVKVPDEILKKPDALTAEEHQIMQRHVEWGVEILSDTRHIPMSALEVVGNHHERYDGSGYMKGLRGGAIGEFGMIGAIVDHYDAITSDRAYRGALSAHSVLMKMYSWRNTLFDGELVEKFIQCLSIYPIGSVVELSTGEIGVVAAINREHRLKPHVMLAYRADRKPYPEMPIVNLATWRSAGGRPCEIERVIDPGTTNIDPVQYLRAAVSL
jgi:putative nucleotidyltransferase with HDIG domain